MSTVKGLDRAKELYSHRGLRARELAAGGQTVIGYFCCQVPTEIMTALNIVPYRMQGKSGESITEADAYLETIMCPFVRSCFDQTLRGEYDFLSGVVIPHTCDSLERVYPVWRYNKNINLQYIYSPNVPSMVHPASFEFFTTELQFFKDSLEQFSDSKISPTKLSEAIKLHNRNRVLLRELYQLRKSHPPLLSGTEIMWVLVAGMGLPVDEYNELLTEVIAEVSARTIGARDRRSRLLIYGSEIDDVSFISLVEECGATVVIDDICTGSRSFGQDVETNGSNLAMLAQRYLESIPCPRTYRPGSAAERFNYIGEFIKEYDAQGAILYNYQFCDSHEIDIPEIREYIEGLNLPVLRIEADYISPSMAQSKTRIQAFVEMIDNQGR